MGFVKVARVSEIPAGTMKHVEAGATELCIANVGGTFYAIGDRCGHGTPGSPGDPLWIPS